jgi:hypothetical protein
VIGANFPPLVSSRHHTCRAIVSRRIEAKAEAKQWRMLNGPGISNYGFWEPPLLIRVRFISDCGLLVVFSHFVGSVCCFEVRVCGEVFLTTINFHHGSDTLKKPAGVFVTGTTS